MDCTNAIETRGLAKIFGEISAVADLSLSVAGGEIFGFLGPNGAGKTTSVKMLTGLIRPSHGSGTLLGAPLGDRKTRSRLGYLPELFRYQEWLTGHEVLRFHAHLTGLRNAKREIDRVLGLAALSERGGDRVGTYSKGMQQRLGLAVALLGEPDLVILDEPTSALDPIGRHEVRQILRTLKAHGTTVFLNSHLLTEVEQLCDRIAIVLRGRIVAQGTIAEIIGVQDVVRVRAQSDGQALQPVLERFGTVSVECDAFLVATAHTRVPELVQALVQTGAQIFAIEPIEATLEDRFLEITGTPQP
jgi:ABC-2 type transport system ATP-binding protein